MTGHRVLSSPNGCNGRNGGALVRGGDEDAEAADGEEGEEDEGGAGERGRHVQPNEADHRNLNVTDWLAAHQQFFRFNPRKKETSILLAALLLGRSGLAPVPI